MLENFLILFLALVLLVAAVIFIIDWRTENEWHQALENCPHMLMYDPSTATYSYLPVEQVRELILGKAKASQPIEPTS